MGSFILKSSKKRYDPDYIRLLYANLCWIKCETMKQNWLRMSESSDSHCDFYFLLMHRADDLSSDLCLQGLVVQSLHGDREQCDREEALQDFRDGMFVSSKCHL